MWQIWQWKNYLALSDFKPPLVGAYILIYMYLYMKTNLSTSTSILKDVACLKRKKNTWLGVSHLNCLSTAYSKFQLFLGSELSCKRKLIILIYIWETGTVTGKDFSTSLRRHSWKVFSYRHMNLSLLPTKGKTFIKQSKDRKSAMP